MIDMTAFISLPMSLLLLEGDNAVSLVISGVELIFVGVYRGELIIGSSCGYSWVSWKFSFSGFMVFLDWSFSAVLPM